MHLLHIKLLEFLLNNTRSIIQPKRFDLQQSLSHLIKDTTLNNFYSFDIEYNQLNKKMIRSHPQILSLSHGSHVCQDQGKMKMHKI